MASLIICRNLLAGGKNELTKALIKKIGTFLPSPVIF